MALITDEGAEFNDVLRRSDGDDLDREELLEMVRSMRAELEIVATLLKHHPEEP